MATKASSKRKITLVVSSKYNNDTIELTNGEATNFLSQYKALSPIIRFNAPLPDGSADGATVEQYLAFDCICRVYVVREKGDDYVKPDCDPAFCEPRAGAQEVL